MTDSAAPTSPRPRNGRWRWLMAAVLLVPLVGMVCELSGAAFESSAREGLMRHVRAEAQFRAESLRAELEQLRGFPIILANDFDARNLLDHPRESSHITSLNRRLEFLTQRTRAKFIYLIDVEGSTLSASNWRAQNSFVGQNFSFRPYFREALTHGQADFFALGAASDEPGLYVSQRVTSFENRTGVIVVKVIFNALEAQWARSPESFFVTDEHGVVLISSVPEWRFNTTRPLDESVLEVMRTTRQFGDGRMLKPLPLKQDTLARDYASAIVSVPSTQWSLWLLAPAAEQTGAARFTGRSIGALAAALLLGIFVIVYRARARARWEAAAQQMAREALERRVVERTRELKITNTQLQQEIGERKRAEASLQSLQDELLQANKFAVLGQISAGVAHEINQPLTAIRTFSDNAAVMLDRNDATGARANLRSINDLVVRVAAITDELRAISRKSSGAPTRTNVRDAVEGALLLTQARARALGVTIQRDDQVADAFVIAHRMRIEQVLLNLLHNALDAVALSAASIVRISMQQINREIWITVDDAGPGLPAEVADALFTPFVTTKENGMGLGLVISQDICREHHGQLQLVPSQLGGAAFRVLLPVAP